MVDTPDLATAMEWIAAHQKVHSVTLFYPDFGDESMPLHEMKALASVGSDGRIAVHTGTDLFEPFRQYPRRYTGTAAAANIETFVAHVVRFKDEDSAIWCNNDPSNPTLTAILDYHMARNVDPEFTDDTKKEPLPLPGAHAQFGQHRTVYKFPLSVEWKAWSAAAGKPMTQSIFAEFVEDRILDVLGDRADADLSDRARQMKTTLGGTFASTARLVELSRGLKLHATSLVGQTNNLSSGEVSIVFESQHVDDKGDPVKIPNLFLIAIPVFRGEDPYVMPVRLRYRIANKNVSWSFEIAYQQETFDHAVAEAAKAVSDKTGLPLFYGTPD